MQIQNARAYHFTKKPIKTPKASPIKIYLP